MLLLAFVSQPLHSKTSRPNLPSNTRSHILSVSTFDEAGPERNERMPKILVVDDNLDTRELTHLHLTTEGFSVIIAVDGREGLYMARSERPDLIITDISMPGLSGIDMIKELRAQPELKKVPILVLSALGSGEMDIAIRAGADRAMNKPVLLDALVDEVKELLSHRNNPPK